MNKAELVEAIAKRTGGTKVSVETTIDALMETVTGALSKGEAVALIGFGTFSMSRLQETGIASNSVWQLCSH